AARTRSSRRPLGGYSLRGGLLPQRQTHPFWRRNRTRAMACPGTVTGFAEPRVRTKGTLAGHDRLGPANTWVLELAFSPDGRHLLTLNPNRTVYVLRLVPVGNREVGLEGKQPNFHLCWSYFVHPGV